MIQVTATTQWKRQTNKQRKAERTYDVCACSNCGTHVGTLTAVRSALTGKKLKAESDGKSIYQHLDPTFCKKVFKMREDLKERDRRLSEVVASETASESKVEEYVPVS